MIKLPKTYTTNGLRMKIKVSAMTDLAGRCDFQKEEIIIDKGHTDNDSDIVEIILHEMIEATFFTAGLRYFNRTCADGQFLFSFNHKEFQVAVGEIARGVLDIVNVNRK